MDTTNLKAKKAACRKAGQPALNTVTTVSGASSRVNISHDQLAVRRTAKGGVRPRSKAGPALRSTIIKRIAAALPPMTQQEIAYYANSFS